MATVCAPIDYRLWRRALPDGTVTTVYAVLCPLRRANVRVVAFPRPQRLDVWCRSAGIEEAVVGGFFVRDPYRPLGEVWAAGRAVRHEPVPEAYAPRRACLVSDGDGVRIVARGEAPERPDGDLLQAGPLLVADGAVAFDPEADHEGFSAAAEQFDSDITQDRHPRAAFGLCDDTLLVVACDGRRTNVDAGLSMLELAGVMVELGARRAINLDGGGSTTLVHRGHLLNRPYSDQDQPAPQTRRVVTALALEPAR
jgi:exopolysaccharide biosynthesis protein